LKSAATRKITPPDWMTAADSAALFEALAAGGASARFVGGCIRDAVLGQPVKDIDIATDALPSTVMALLQDRMIRAIPTGIDHGTITALPGDRPFEITTLRRDVRTDGRRAKVEFGEDWEADARRRDFTMNALYADPDGTVHDYVDGLPDLDAGRVRFIGEAAERIREDYLRVLRYFRFQAWYGRTDPDPEALAACRAGAASTANLAGERVWQEFARILGAPDPADTILLMEDTNVLHHVLRVRWRATGVRAMATLEGAVGRPADPIRRLAALVLPGQREISQVAARLRLSRDETRRFSELMRERGSTAHDMPAIARRRALYALGADLFGDMILLDWTDDIARHPGTAAERTEGWRELWREVQAWTPPHLPVAGADVLELGVEEGPAVGEILKAVEAWWVDKAFRPDRAACLERLRQAVERRRKEAQNRQNRGSAR